MVHTANVCNVLAYAAQKGSSLTLQMP